MDRWLSGVGEALAFYPVVAKTRVALLEQAAEEYERFVRQRRGDDREMEIERGRTYLRLGHLRRELRDAAGLPRSPIPKRRTLGHRCRQRIRISRTARSNSPTPIRTWDCWLPRQDRCRRPTNATGPRSLGYTCC